MIMLWAADLSNFSAYLIEMCVASVSLIGWYITDLIINCELYRPYRVNSYIE